MADVAQWRDIHNLLLALHEGLLAGASDAAFTTISSENDDVSSELVQQILQTVSADNNDDQISKFWASILDHLNVYSGYYFAIGSGNFALRNACLPKLAELFFAYNHRNYQELVGQHIKDLNDMPSYIKQPFTKESGPSASQAGSIITLH